jgi:GTP cyclohydrolase I
MRELVRQLLVDLGEDPEREGLLNTPTRVEKALTFLTSGYHADIDSVLNGALFSVDYSEMVIGLSKIPRLVDVFSRRLQVQERLTSQIAETIRDKITPLGVAVVMEATHLCMSMRGVQKQNSFAVTSSMLGAFRDSARTRMEFLSLIKPSGGGRSRSVPVRSPSGFRSCPYSDRLK